MVIFAFIFWGNCLMNVMLPPGPSYANERNHYEVLGVSRNASRDEIKKAFHEVIITHGIEDALFL